MMSNFPLLNFLFGRGRGREEHYKLTSFQRITSSNESSVSGYQLSRTSRWRVIFEFSGHRMTDRQKILDFYKIPPREKFRRPLLSHRSPNSILMRLLIMVFRVASCILKLEIDSSQARRGGRGEGERARNRKSRIPGNRIRFSNIISSYFFHLEKKTTRQTHRRYSNDSGIGMIPEKNWVNRKLDKKKKTKQNCQSLLNFLTIYILKLLFRGIEILLILHSGETLEKIKVWIL